MSQLAGLEDMASRVLLILSMSVHPSRDMRELAASVLESPPLHSPSLSLLSSPTLCTLEVKLMTDPASSPAPPWQLFTLPKVGGPLGEGG